LLINIPKLQNSQPSNQVYVGDIECHSVPLSAIFHQIQKNIKKAAPFSLGGASWL